MNSNYLKIKILVLLNGQHMIGKVIKEDEKEIVVESPAILMTGDNDKEEKRMSLAFAPFLPFSSDKTFTFRSDLVLTTSNPIDALINEYNRLFGSGLDIITKPSLIV
jgi:hypothetical protein